MTNTKWRNYTKVLNGWKKQNGLFYHKAGAGIENNPNCKRGKVENFACQGKIKGKGHKSPYKGMYREKSKSEINALMEC